MTYARSALLTIALSASLLGVSAIAHAQTANPIEGRWLTEGGKAVVVVAPCGSQLCGRIERVLDPRAPRDARDINNPNAALRTRPVQGLQILSGFARNGSRWSGRIYDPEEGKSYRSNLSMGRDGKLNVQGCIGPFCQTQRWTRAR